MNSTSTVDLVTYRQYKLDGIAVIMKIDKLNKRVSMVEYDQNSKSFKNKKWEFLDRELEYMAGWQAILAAMSHAVAEATKELEQVKDEDMKKFMKLMVDLKDFGKGGDERQS